MTLNEATKGFWAATVLLITRRSWYLSYLGAFIILTSFAIGPSIQQAVEIRLQKVPTLGSASIAICNNSDPDFVGLPGQGAGLYKISLATLGAIYDGLLQTRASNVPQIPFVCPGGNCTFERYQSLGLCSECADLSDELMLYNRNELISAGDPPFNSTLSVLECLSGIGCKVEWLGCGLSLSHSAPSILPWTLRCYGQKIRPQTTIRLS